MATNSHLPKIHTLDVGDKGTADDGARESSMSKKTSKTTSFLSRLQLGSLEQIPLPGDVYYPPSTHSKQPRPLGLIPNRNDRLAALKKLSQLFSPPGYHPPEQRVVRRIPSQVNVDLTERPVGTISATIKASSFPSVDPSVTCTDTVAYRIPQQDLSGTDAGTSGDPDYMTLGEKASEYYSFIRPPHGSPAPVGGAKHPGTLGGAKHPGTRSLASRQGQDGKKTTTRRQAHSLANKDPHYFNFTGQAQLFQRSLMDDRRDALGYEPCERCRLRGGRCARCKALRTGGGYIILDAGMQEEWMGRRRREGYEFWSGTGQSVGEKKVVRRKRPGDNMAMDKDDGRIDNGEEKEGSGGASRAGGSGRRWEGQVGRRDGLSWGGDGDGVGRRDDGGQVGGDVKTKLGTQGQRQHNMDGLSDQMGRNDQGSREMDTSSSRGEGRCFSEDGEGATDRMRSGSRPISGHRKEWGEESGRLSRASQSGSGLGRSRPGSTHGARPGSSLRKSGRGVERGKRARTGTDAEGGPNKVRQSRGREEEDNEEGRGKRRGRPPSAAQDKSDGYKGPEFEFSHDREDSEKDKDSFHGNLMKFKRKKENVKAIHATLKELQGIDPLDYLARYCIIDQSKLPHYQHTFNNVDRDEDDEIDIGELDFALKAVNYDLISDAEMEYVHSVLELAGRYKLNFRLFSVIAALSEKVVALEDMVKRLINKMNFDALEVKMKKCKELFYLLADSDVSSMEHEGGVVTTSSLAVELQAGGLTQEHVEFVVDRLNHEDKGLVEFLDYLTYVPLFVEIHDNIYGNPLDFSRTK